MAKAQTILEIILLLQGTPLDEFSRNNFATAGERPVVRCAETSSVATSEGDICKRSVATALRRYSYRFTGAQLALLADLYVSALDRLEPDALPRVRQQMCDPASDESRRDADAARAVCDRLSQDY